MSDDLKFIITIIAGLFTGGVIQFFASRRKNTSDAYSTLLDALTKSGEVIGDDAEKMKKMIDMLVKLPQLESQLRTAQDRISTLERQSSFWISFARTYYDGSKKLHAQVLRLAVEQPEFDPGRFPTGPLSSGSTAS